MELEAARKQVLDADVGRVFQPVRMGPDGLENPSYKS